MVEAITRPTRIQVSRAAVAHNMAVVAESSQSERIFLAVKSNAYGFGLLPMSQAAVAGGAYGLGVAVLDEASYLRQHGITVPIMIFGITDAQYARQMASQQLIATVSSLAWLVAAERELCDDLPLAVSLGVDTGMGRIGFRDSEELAAAVTFVLAHPKKFIYKGMGTHFADSDSADRRYFDMQLARWHALTDDLPAPEYYHLANSGAALYHPEDMPMEVIRAGTVVYGIEPSRGELASGDNLAPVLSLVSALNFVKCVPAGECISYSHTYTTTGDEWIGTVPIGYGDGWLRKFTGFQVIINGQYAPIVGKIAMDQLMVRLPAELPVGTKVTLLGRDGDCENTLEDAAQHVGLAPWEVSIGLQERIPRQLVD